MAQAVSNTARHQAAVAPAEFSLMLDIPQDVRPNIFSRLPGTAFFSLAQVCKRMRMEKNLYSKEWVSRELHEISSLVGDALWARFLDLTENCSLLINSVEWEAFLGDADLRDPGSAAALRMAGPAPKDAEAAHSPREKLGMQDAANFDVVLKAAMSYLERCVSDGQQLARMRGAVFIGCWRHIIRHAVACEKILLYSLAEQIKSFSLPTQMIFMAKLDNPRSDFDLADAAHQFLVNSIPELPVWLQLEVTPYLGTSEKGNEIGDAAYCRVWELHASALLEKFALQLPGVNVARASPPYLASLVRMCQRSLAHPNHRLLRNAWMSVDQLFTRSLGAEMAIGPWREQPDELAIFLILTVACMPLKQTTATTLQNRLIECQFITEAECHELHLYADVTTHSRFTAVARWIASNRSEKPLPVCTIS